MALPTDSNRSRPAPCGNDAQSPAGLVQVDQRKYGDTVVTLLKAAA